ncbi:MAG: hypothetical protein Q8P97_00810, partial [bacterium]|nr:hypothetical protein [bacterium]
MSKNNNDKKIPIVTIVVTTVAVLGLGYFLFKSSPQNQSPSTASVDNMHGGSAMAVNSDALNS